jgi:hypothetical protein
MYLSEACPHALILQRSARLAARDKKRPRQRHASTVVIGNMVPSGTFRPEKACVVRRSLLWGVFISAYSFSSISRTLLLLTIILLSRAWRGRQRHMPPDLGVAGANRADVLIAGVLLAAAQMRMVLVLVFDLLRESPLRRPHDPAGACAGSPRSGRDWPRPRPRDSDYARSRGRDRPRHPATLLRRFVVRCSWTSPC